MSIKAPVPASQPFSFGGYAGQHGEIQGVAFWPRVAARVIDLLVHFCITFGAGIFFYIVLAIAASMSGHPLILWAVRLSGRGIEATVFSLLGSIAYEAVCEGMHGSTVGKLALSMVVLQEDGSPCRMKSALIRSLGYLVDAQFFGFVGYQAMKGNPRQQRYADTWAHTFVCKRSKAPNPESLRSGSRFNVALLLAAIADSAFIIAGMLLRLAH
jgi:uncharacterized RDD family membrane protein YckC